MRVKVFGVFNIFFTGSSKEFYFMPFVSNVVNRLILTNSVTLSEQKQFNNNPLNIIVKYPVSVCSRPH